MTCRACTPPSSARERFHHLRAAAAFRQQRGWRYTTLRTGAVERTSLMRGRKATRFGVHRP